MADDKKDYQDYLDYQEYNKYLGGQKQAPQDMENKILKSVGKTISPKYEQQAQDYKKNLPNAFTGMEGELAGPVTKLGRVGANAGLNALMGYLKPGSQQEKLENAAMYGTGGAILGTAAEGLSGLASKAADRIQQSAVGMRKFDSGTGTDLIRQGVYGTKSQMTEKVANNIAEKESQLQDLVKSLKGDVSSNTLADAVADKANRFTLPSGETAGNMGSYLNKIKDTANSIRDIGRNADQSGYMVDKRISAPDLLALKRQGDYLGYTNSGNPATSLDAELGRAQADAARSSLSSLSENQETTVPTLLSQERSNILAKQGLEKPESVGSGVDLKDVTALGVGGLFGGGPGAAIGLAAKKALNTPLAKSLGAKTLEQGVSPTAKGLFGPKIAPQALDAVSQSGQGRKKNED